MSNEIVTVSTVWDQQASNGEKYGPWLLTFHLTDLGDGRLQCVGFEMRSYLRASLAGTATVAGSLTTVDATWADPSELEATPEITEVDATWLAERKAKGLPVPDLEVHGAAPTARAERLMNHLFETDPEGASVSADEVLRRPRELQATMVKSLQFGGALGDALRQAARDRLGSASFLGAVAQDEGLYSSLPAEEAARLRRTIAAVSQVAEEAAAELHASGRRPGRPAQHGREELERAARYYTQFWRNGHRNPSALVAEHLNVKPNVAAKLIQACRRPDTGLLPPSTGTRPEAWAPGEAPWERNTEGPSRYRAIDQSTNARG